MTDDDLDEIEMAHRARLRAEAEVATLTTLLRLAEASVSLLRAGLAASELRERRLRAAEAPGTDDGAVAPWEWRGRWVHPSGAAVYPNSMLAHVRWSGWADAASSERFSGALALDAMRAAVPGSV